MDHQDNERDTMDELEEELKIFDFSHFPLPKKKKES